MLKSRFGIIFFVLLILFTGVVLLQFKFYKIAGEQKLSGDLEKKITGQASLSLKTLDVPVGALLVYKGDIIGRGYNTVLRDSNLAGHAEINALNDALKNYGLKKFNMLDRDELVLYTSYEPCEMCRGAMIHYNVRHIKFMKPKSLWHWWLSGIKSFRYEINKRETNGKNVQDSLFMLHPEFPGRND